MNELSNDVNYSEMKAELQALRKKLEDLETRQAAFTGTNHPTARRKFPKTLIVTSISLVALLVGSSLLWSDDIKALFIDEKGNVHINGAVGINRPPIAGQSLLIGAATGIIPFNVANSAGQNWLTVFADGQVKMNGGDVSIAKKLSVGDNANFSGNVGKNNPRAKLDVQGNVGVNGALIFPTDTGDKISFFGEPLDKYGLGIQHNTLQIYSPNAQTRIALGWGHSNKFQEGMSIQGGNATFTGDVNLKDNMFALGGPENLRMLRGTIKADGTPLTGKGFTVGRKGPGAYYIKFDKPFATPPSASVTQIYRDDTRDFSIGDTRDNAVIVNIDNTQMEVGTGGNTGDRRDRSFTFVILGPTQ